MNDSRTVPVSGIDVTSAPSRRKPLTVAQGHWDGNVLHLESIELLESIGALKRHFDAIDPRLPSVTGLDCPLGQPRRLVENLGWPAEWEVTVERFAAMNREELLAFFEAYRAPRSPGDKQHRRLTDIATGGCSPMMVHGVPVGRMYHAVVPLLAGSTLNLLPCRPSSSPATVLEVYPALLARQAAPGRRYKSESDRQEGAADRRDAREAILERLESGGDSSPVGFPVRLPADRLGAIEDPKGDRLDAILAAASAAWAWSKRDEGWGFSSEFDPFEGAIVDPTPLPA